MFGDAAAQALKDGKGETRWEKMSKSKGNGVEPSHIVREVGVDAARLNVLFKVRGCDRLLPPQSASRVLLCPSGVSLHCTFLFYHVHACAYVCVCVPEPEPVCLPLCLPLCSAIHCLVSVFVPGVVRGCVCCVGPGPTCQGAGVG